MSGLTKLKVESGGQVYNGEQQKSLPHYSKEYTKEELVGKMHSEEFLSDAVKLK